MNRTTIVDAALELLDEAGLDALTVRRLAQRLDVKSPALYWHFRGKQELLDEVADRLRALQDSGPPAPGEDWPAWLRRRARERRSVLMAHRDSARLMAGTRIGRERLAAVDAELAVLVGFGFTPVRAVRAATLVDHYVVGSVLERQADHRRHAGSGEAPPEDPERTLPTGAAPVLAAALREGGDPEGDAAFEEGLSMVVDGVAAALERDG